jgi:hypothetical protein
VAYQTTNKNNFIKKKSIFSYNFEKDQGFSCLNLDLKKVEKILKIVFSMIG